MASCFVSEPFTQEMYGPELLDRWGGSWSLYSSLMIESSTVALGARVGEVALVSDAGCWSQLPPLSRWVNPRSWFWSRS